MRCTHAMLVYADHSVCDNPFFLPHYRAFEFQTLLRLAIVVRSANIVFAPFFLRLEFSSLVGPSHGRIRCPWKKIAINWNKLPSAMTTTSTSVARVDDSECQAFNISIFMVFAGTEIDETPRQRRRRWRPRNLPWTKKKWRLKIESHIS